MAEKYLQTLIEHAQKQRNQGGAEAKKMETIVISPEWWDKLQAVPFKSNCRGRTVHLLKQGSKPVATDKKRLKFNLAGTFAEY